MNTPSNPFPNIRLVIAALGLAAMGAAHADSGRLMPREVLPAYTQECAACHTAYPPGMLPAPSWQRIMGGLENHYGSDASLDPATVKQLSTWLQTHAGTYKRVSDAPPDDRITRSVWFVRKHREVALSVWGLPSVKSAANCAACHSGADKGDFDDDRLIFPAGLDARMRRTWRD